MVVGPWGWHLGPWQGGGFRVVSVCFGRDLVVWRCVLCLLGDVG